MKKGLICLLISIVLLTGMMILPVHAQTSVSVILNDRPLTFDQDPIVVEGRTLVPLRAIFEELGATVQWDEATQTVTAIKNSTNLSLTIGNAVMILNDKAIELDVAPQLVGSRTLVPLRAVSEAFGADVLWDEQANSVYIYDNDTTAGNGAWLSFTNEVVASQIEDEQGDYIADIHITVPRIVNPNNEEGIKKINDFFLETAVVKMLVYSNDAQLNITDDKNALPYQFQVNYEIGYNANNILSVILNIDSYTDGISRECYVFDVIKGEELKITDLMVGTEEEINANIEQTFTTLINEESEFYFPNAKEIIKEEAAKAEFYINNGALMFTLDMGSIAPLAFGYPEFGVSLSNEHMFHQDLTDVVKGKTE